MKRSTTLFTVGLAVLGLAVTTVPAYATLPDPATIAAAKTPADQEAIAKAYEDETASLEKMAAMHKNLGEAYAQPGGKPWQAGQAKHCKSVASELAAAARNERAPALEHHKMAKESVK